MSNPGHRHAAAKAARAEVERQPVFLDTETTGIDAEDEIVEICVIDHDGRTLFESLVRPTRPVSHGAYRVHGISALVLRDAPAWPEAWAAVRAVLAGRRVGIYNARFDLTMMRNSHRAHALDWDPGACDAFCIMEMYAQFNGERGSGYGAFRWQSLAVAGRQCRIALPNAHRAAADARLARAVLLHMAMQSPPAI
jgi:DNA polymerase-3 subunit epsilon